MDPILFLCECEQERGKDDALLGMCSFFGEFPIIKYIASGDTEKLVFIANRIKNENIRL